MESLGEMYRCIPTRDFSREVLEPNAKLLRMLRVPDIGWSDLGTPKRLRRALWRRGLAPPEATPDPWAGLAPPTSAPKGRMALETSLTAAG